jgi:hypothetical protein
MSQNTREHTTTIPGRAANDAGQHAREWRPLARCVMPPVPPRCDLERRTAATRTAEHVGAIIGIVGAPKPPKDKPKYAQDRPRQRRLCAFEPGGVSGASAGPPARPIGGSRAVDHGQPAPIASPASACARRGVKEIERNTGGRRSPYASGGAHRRRQHHRHRPLPPRRPW